MKKIAGTILALLYSTTSYAGEYKAGWDAENFYINVLECKKYIVVAAASSYTDARLVNKHEKVSLQNEVISMVPTFDAVASSTCFCALNEIAKHITYKEQQKGIDFQSYLDIPRCKEAWNNTMKSIKNNPEGLKLK